MWNVRELNVTLSITREIAPETSFQIESCTRKQCYSVILDAARIEPSMDTDYTDL